MEFLNNTNYSCKKMGSGGFIFRERLVTTGFSLLVAGFCTGQSDTRGNFSSGFSPLSPVGSSALGASPGMGRKSGNAAAGAMMKALLPIR
jgi:hypothetical protein